VPRSDAQAAHWYRLAAEQGYARAQFNLGLMHEDGRGGPKNEQQAYFWWLLAAAQGKAEAARNRDRIEPQLTAQQRAAAQAQARDWRPGTALAQAPPPNRVQRLPPPPRAAAGFALRQGAS
jgi:TPR repeat protein